MQPDTGAPLNRRWLLAAAWISTLAVSILPDVLFNEFGSGAPPWLFWAKIVLLATGILVSFFWTAITALRPYWTVLAVILLGEWGLPHLGNWIGWQTSAMSPFSGSSFTDLLLRDQTIGLVAALVMIALLFIMKRNRRAFFLVKGEVDAPAQPVRWLLDAPIPWTRFGAYLGLFLSLGTLLFLVLAGRPSLQSFLVTLPLLPWVLLFSVTNAFSEEVSYRLAGLSTLETPLGKSQSLLLTASFFGIAHYYGVPYGLIGVLMAALLGWFLGKSVLETRGMFWAWFIHFLQDVVIFYFLAMGAITAGGDVASRSLCEIFP